MFRPGGYLYSFDPGGVRQEADTFTCHHCNRVVIVRPKCSPDDLGGMCRLCMKMICPSCVELGLCTPFEKKIEEQETREYRLRCFGV
jgi:hypothetical protein